MTVRALVTGARGFCGRHLTRLLETRGVAVATLSQEDDWSTPASLSPAVKKAAPDLVFHLAGAASGPDPTAYYRINVMNTAVLFAALERAGFADRPTLVIGTSAEYGLVSEDALPLTEQAPARPYNHYGASKLAQSEMATILARETGRPIVVARPFNVIGPGMPAHIAVRSFADQVAAIKEGKAPATIRVGNLSSTRDFIDVRDTVRCYWNLLRTPSAYGKIINVCTGAETTVGELLERLIRLAGVNVEIVAEPERMKPIDVPRHAGSPALLEKLAGPLEFMALDQTLTDILEGAGRQ